MHFLSFSLDFSSISDHSVQLFPGSSSFSFGLYDGVPQGLTLLSFTNWMISVCHVFQIHYTIYQLCSISYLSQKRLSVNKFETEPLSFPASCPLSVFSAFVSCSAVLLADQARSQVSFSFWPTACIHESPHPVHSPSLNPFTSPLCPASPLLLEFSCQASLTKQRQTPPGQCPPGSGQPLSKL